MEDSFKYTFPAIRGIQARREYYTSMCPLHMVSKIFVFDDEELTPELRAQRVLNKTRLGKIKNYITKNSDDYAFSAITVSVDADIKFESMGPERNAKRLGLLHIPMSAKFVLNDGQHRRAAIELALKEKPELANETIAVVFFQDIGLERCQQIFSDLNRYAIRPSKSISILYDHRDNLSLLTKTVVFKSAVFQDLVDLEKSTLSTKSKKLFTLSSIYSANSALLSEVHRKSFDDYVELANLFWEEVAKYFPLWHKVKSGEISAEKLRREYIHSHALTLQAIGRACNSLLLDGKSQWKKKLKKLALIDWSRSNTQLWEGRAMIGGRVSKASNNVTLTTNVIKQRLGIELLQEEEKVEKAFLGENYEEK